MRNAKTMILLAGASAMLAGCGGSGIFNRDRPDEFAVQRQAPLVVPPDFELVPPQPGAPRPVEGTASQQALEALFGGPARRSDVENSTLEQAGEPVAGIRSQVGDVATNTVDKGVTTRAILAAPENEGTVARALIPG